MLNRGDIYERYIFKELLDSNLTKLQYSPAGADKTKPDTKFLVNGKAYNLEIKLDLNVDFGQGTLRYNFNEFKWEVFSENQEMQSILEYFSIDEYANSVWKKIPNRVGKDDIGRDPKPISKLSSSELSEDRKNFQSKFKRISGKNPIAQYYNSKDTYYIQIGGKFKNGFYYMGSDPANLGVPEFKPTETQIRIRNKNGRFTTALILRAGTIQTSDYDIEKSVNFILNAGR